MGMKTFEFKLHLTKEQKELIEEQLTVLKIVWNRAIALLEWKQYYQRALRCIDDEWIDTWGFELKPVAIEVNKIDKDWCYFSRIAAEFRRDKKKGWEVKDNIEVRPVINLVKPHWQEEPLIKGYSAIDLRKPFAQKRYPWIKEQNIPMLLVNDFIGIVVASAWKAYIQGKRKKPRYKRRRDKIVTIPSESFRKHCQRDGNLVKLPGLDWLEVKGLSDRLAENADISTFKICKKPSGYYLQLGVHTEKIRKCRQKETTINLNPLVYHTDGCQVEIPRYLQESLDKIEKLQRKLSTQEIGSNRWRKQVNKIARVHEKIKRQRKGWQDWHSSAIADVYGFVTLEELEIPTPEKPDPIIDKDGQRYLPNGAKIQASNNQNSLDSGVGAFKEKIIKKVEERGGTIIVKEKPEQQIEVSTEPEKPTKSKKPSRKRNNRRKKLQQKLEPAQ